MPKSFPEVFVSNSSIALTVSRKLKKGEIRKLGSWIYTTNLKEKPEILIRRHAWMIVEELFPEALIAEIHPFSDGNGRCARLMMNAGADMTKRNKC